MNVEIREYIESDFQELVNCINSFEDYYAFLSGNQRKSRSPDFGEKFTPFLIQKTKSQNGQILVAKQGSTIIGFAAGIILEQDAFDRVANGENKYGVVQELFVKEDYRNNSIGKQLLEKLENHFKEQDCTAIKIEIDYINKEVEHFYQKVGYKPRSTIVYKSIIKQ